MTLLGAQPADALTKLGCFSPVDYPALVLKVFDVYMRVCRRLQTVYWLEPAGSHGVWSLDDYQMLPFLFGSAQLEGSKHVTPKSIHNDDVLEAVGADYLYLQAIGFIKSVKSGGTFAEHSPILNDISALPTWEKVNKGMMKMYVGEVLGKRPVVQHFVFGTVLECSWTPTKPAPRPERVLPRGVTLGVSMRSASSGAAASGGAPMGVAPWASSPAAPAAAAADGTAPAAAGPALGRGTGPAGVPMGVAPWAAGAARRPARAPPAPGGGGSGTDAGVGIGGGVMMGVAPWAVAGGAAPAPGAAPRLPATVDSSAGAAVGAHTSTAGVSAMSATGAAHH